MGMAQDYLCTNCSYEADFVTEDFDCGMNGEVVTTVVCVKHALVEASTGMCAWDEDAMAQPKGAYPCPKCRRESPLWDRKTCPKCGHETLKPHPLKGYILWD